MISTKHIITINDCSSSLLETLCHTGDYVLWWDRRKGVGTIYAECIPGLEGRIRSDVLSRLVDEGFNPNSVLRRDVEADIVRHRSNSISRAWGSPWTLWRAFKYSFLLAAVLYVCIYTASYLFFAIWGKWIYFSVMYL